MGMDYQLIKVNLLDETSVLGDDDFILAEVRDSSQGDRFKTYKMKGGIAFQSTNIRLSNAGQIQIDLNDPVFDPVRDQFPDDLITQDDANTLFGHVISAMLDAVNTAPNILIQSTPPVLAPALDGSDRYHPEGTLWIDSRTFRTYTYFYNRDDITDVIINRLWIGLTDR